ncbi:hypothetical protein LSUE1_G010282, partial [Lachnellula suecica]
GAFPSPLQTQWSPDDLSYPPPPSSLFANLDDPSDIAQRAEASASDLEARIVEHLHSVFAHWNGLSPQKRQEIWMLEFARSVGKKSEEIKKLKREKEYDLQEMTHLKQQVDELSRLQHPREFRLVSPTTVGLSAEVMTEMGEMGMRQRGVGFELMDRHVHLDTAIKRAVGRWKTVVKEARGGGAGLVSQRSLSGESAPVQAAPSSVPTTSVSAPPSSHQQAPPPPPQQIQQQRHIAPAPQNMNHQRQGSNGSQSHTQNQQHQNHNASLQDSDADADADADMEDDDSFVDMNDAPAAKFRLSNGNGNGGGGGQQGMEGLEHSVVQGYVRIGA